MTHRIAVAVAVLALAAQAQTSWYVDVNGIPPGSGTQADPYTSIQHAISQASTLPGDTVLVLPGIYQETIDFLGKAIEVRSTGGQAATTIDNSGIGGPAASFVSGESSLSILDGFTITNSSGTFPFTRGLLLNQSSPTLKRLIVAGHYSGNDGGGASLVGSSATFSDCTFLRNGGCFRGGGMYMDNSSPTLTDCAFIENYATFGAALSSLASHPQLLRCTFTDNPYPDACFSGQATSGGAVECTSSNLLAIDCLFENNYAYRGGGLWAGNSDVLAIRCTIRSGCGEGGAVYLSSCPDAHFVDCDIADNWSVFDRAGGMYLMDSQVRIEGTSIHGNATGGDGYAGGGVFAEGGNLQVHDSLVYDNEAQWGAGLYLLGPASITSTVITDNRIVIGWPFAWSAGGGVFGTPGVTLSRCLVTKNDSTSSYGVTGQQFGLGGGVFGPVVLTQCVLWGNSADNEGGGAYDSVLNGCVVSSNTSSPGAANLGGNSQATFCNVEGGWPGAGNIDAPPRFWAAANDDFHLLPGSPCIDAGDPTSPVDPDGSRADMGVYPYDPSYCGEPFTYCEGKTNSLGCVPFLTTSGFPSATSTEPFEIVANEVLPGEGGFMVYGFNKSMLGFHGGTLCVKAPIARVLPPKFAKSNGAPPCTGRLILGFNKRIQSGVDVLLIPGQTVYAQIRQRDPHDPAGFGDGLTDAVQFTICP